MGAVRRRTALVTVLVVAMVAVSACGPSVYTARDKKDVPTLVALAEDTDASILNVREPAVEALGTLGTQEANDALVNWLENGAPAELENAVYRAAGASGDVRAVEPLLVALESIDRGKSEAEMDPGDSLKLWSVIEGLGGLVDPRVQKALLAELDAGHSGSIQDRRLSDALEGQGETIASALEKRLENSDPAVFEPAAMALAGIYKTADRGDRVIELLRGKKTFRIYAGVITGDVSVDRQVVIDSLNSVGDATMAQRMLNSGSAEYEEAAKTWATKHGYTIESWIVP